MLRPERMLVLSSLFIIGFLIAVNALYVAAEFSLVSVRRTRVQQLAEEGKGLAARLLPIIGEPAALDGYIAACQVGITASSLVVGAFGQAAFAPLLARPWIALGGWDPTAAYSVASVIVLVVLTTGQMVFGELLPKAVALRFPAETAMYTVVPMTWSRRLFSGLIAVLNGSGLLLLRALRIPHTGSRHVHSPEEIDYLLEESSSGGVLTPEEHRRLHRALYLSTRTAAQLMVPREQIVAVAIDAADDDILRLASESPYTRLPVYRGTLDTIEGVLHTKDVLMSQIRRGTIRPVRGLMRPAARAPASTAADQLLTMFREQQTQLAIVTGEDGKVVGLVTLENALAEVFGELSDEFEARRRHRRGADRGTRERPEPAR